MCAMSEPPLPFDADDSRLVEETGQVVEVDTTNGPNLVAEVPPVQRDRMLAAIPAIAQPGADLGQRLAGEFGAFVQEEADFATVCNVRRSEHFAGPDVLAPVDSRESDSLWRLHQRVAVDRDGARQCARRVEHCAAGAAGGDGEGRIVDLTVVPRAAQRHLQCRGQSREQFHLEPFPDYAIGVEKCIEVRTAAHSGELGVIERVAVRRDRQPRAAVEQFRLQAKFGGKNLFGISDRHGVAEQHTPLDGRRAVATGDPAVDLYVLGGMPGQCDVAAQIVVLGIDADRSQCRASERCDDALGDEVFAIAGVAAAHCELPRRRDTVRHAAE